MNANIIKSIEWHRDQLEKLVSHDDFYRLEIELDSMIEKAEKGQRTELRQVKRGGKVFQRKTRVGVKETDGKSFWRGTDLKRRFDAEELDPDSLDYAKSCAYRKVDKMRGKNKTFGMAYIKYVEGKGPEPTFVESGISISAANKIRNGLTSYKNQVTGEKPSVGVIS